ncbi:ADP-ribosylation factor-binding protein GGA3-like isoform X2 [Oopsacas minuta]|uniref:ADP-ribosylation factor-binding protein GGA3-like isoform X2 n=1 Tax=Oopsacas minuta TaxID=111878 RepID=A0AAV7KMB4_9METZ|nr:ADP-ribosylation factor-binding protein GGA3-like isoform X2 [Oopsacas minuta]
MVTKDDGFDSIFNKAKNTTNRFQDWEFVMSFCERVNEEPEGPQAAIKVLVTKLRSEDEETQLLALAVIEACVKNCGVKFHNEVGKFKLLNELIKLISPKYSASNSSEQLKGKVRGLFFQWRRGLPKQGKILDAYEMLKKEGLIDDEGNLPDAPPPQVLDEPARDSIIKDEREIETLERLLKSKNPQDFVRANEMIQDRYKRENIKLEKLQHRSRELDLVDNNAKLLDELLGHFSLNSSQPERDLIEELKKSCVTMREKLQKIAEQCTDDDVLLNKLCTSSDGLVKVLDKYETVMANINQTRQVNSQDIPPLISSPPTAVIQPQVNITTDSLLDSLIDLDLSSTVPTPIPIQPNPIPIQPNPIPIQPNPIPIQPSPIPIQHSGNSDISSLLDDFGPFNSMPLSMTPDPLVSAKSVDLPLIQNPQLPQPILQTIPSSYNLDAVEVTNNSIQLCPIPAVLAYNKDNIILTLSTGKLIEPILNAPELKVAIISMINISPFGIDRFVLHAATSKNSKLKLFPPSLQSILPFTPFQSCPVLTQILLIQPEDIEIVLKLKFSFSIGGRELSEVIDMTELRWI